MQAGARGVTGATVCVRQLNRLMHVRKNVQESLAVLMCMRHDRAVDAIFLAATRSL
jgi:hypothetical protein